MRVLGTSVLIFEAIMVALAIPVAYFTGAAARGATAAWICAGLAVLCLIAAGLVTRPYGLIVGWTVQALIIASGFLVTSMFVLGGIFALLWWAAVHFGRRADDARARRDAPPPGSQQA